MLYYQPKVNLRLGTVVGAEALIRWQHPEHGLLAPHYFLPVIEHDPLAVDLGEWVIETALTQMDDWRVHGLDLAVSVNVSARQLQHADFVGRLRALLAAHPGIKPSSLTLEVLETSALDDLARVSQVVADCREIGVSFTLDDCGAGDLSAKDLKHLSVTLLKIGRSFIGDMLENPEDLAIVERVLGLSRVSRHPVVATGMETRAQGEMLLNLGCELAQGYVIAHPMPAHEVAGWSSAWRPPPHWANLPRMSRADLPAPLRRDRAARLDCRHRTSPPVRPGSPAVAGSPSVPLRRLATRRRADPPWRATAFQSLATLHQRVHDLALELLDLHAQERNPEALARLGELHGLRDALLERLKEMAC